MYLTPPSRRKPDSAQELQKFQQGADDFEEHLSGEYRVDGLLGPRIWPRRLATKS